MATREIRHRKSSRWSAAEPPARAAGRRRSNPISPITPGPCCSKMAAFVFDMRTAHYSVAESHGRCLLQLWSEERNMVRTVVDVKERAQCLRLATRRMGAAKPQSLELAPTSDRRTPTARDTARRNYLRLLERVLARHYIGAKVDGLAHGHGSRAQLRSRLRPRPAAQGHRGRCSHRRRRRRIRLRHRRRSHSGHSLARLLPPARRRAPPFRRPQSDRSCGSLAHDGRAHGVAEPRRRRF